MVKDDLRLVEYSISQKGKSKKGKKRASGKKFGFFHAWGTAAGNKGKEKFFGLIEDTETGRLSEVGFKKIRFVDEFAVEEVITEAEETVAADTAAQAETAE